MVGKSWVSYSETRWWSTFLQVESWLVAWGSISAWVVELKTRGVAVEATKKLDAFLIQQNNLDSLTLLKMEVTMIVELMRPFMMATYFLEVCDA